MDVREGFPVPISSVASNAGSVRSTMRATPVKCVVPPIPSADPVKLSLASAAKRGPVSTHTTASTVSPTPKKAVVVGTLGQKPIDETIEAESEKENQTPVPPPPVSVEIPTVPISAPVAEPLVSNMSSVITIRPKLRAEVNLTIVNHEHKKTSSSASTSSVATLKRKKFDGIPSRTRNPPHPHPSLPNNLCATLSRNNNP